MTMTIILFFEAECSFQATSIYCQLRRQRGLNFTTQYVLHSLALATALFFCELATRYIQIVSRAGDEAVYSYMSSLLPPKRIGVGNLYVYV